MKSKSPYGKINAFAIAVLLFHACVLFSACSGSTTKGHDATDEPSLKMSLQVDLGDFARQASTMPNDATLLKAIANSNARSSDSKNYLAAFIKEFRALSPNANLAVVFPIVSEGMSDSAAIETLHREVNTSVSDNIIPTLRKRLEKIDIDLSNFEIADDIVGRIDIELRGDTDPKRIKAIIEQRGQLEFYETFKVDEIRSELSRIAALDPDTDGLEQFKKLLSNAQPAYCGIGYVTNLSDVKAINSLINSDTARAIMPDDFILRWSAEPEREYDYTKNKELYVYRAYALKTNHGRAAMDGSSVTDAEVVEDEEYYDRQISMEMDSKGAREWETLTKCNIGRAIAIVIDDKVYSAPVVNMPISGGRSSIAGNFTKEEAQDIANLLKAGNLKTHVRVVSSEVIPSE